MDRRLLIIIVTGLGCVVSMAGFFTTNLNALYVLVFCLGGLSNPLYSLLIAYANDYLEQDQMPAASGGLLFINGVGAMSGPAIVGALMNAYGSEYFFVFTSALMLIICAYGTYRTSVRQSTSVDDAAPYMPITSRSTQIAAEIAIDAIDEEANDEDSQSQSQ